MSGGERGSSEHRVTGPDTSFSVLSVLTGLDDDDPATRREAVAAIRTAVDDDPAACVPTVAKLRGLLEDESIDYHDEVLYCLAELAEEAPTDVAPSTDTIVAFTTERHPSQATSDAFRALASVASQQPGVLIDHVDPLVDALEIELEEWGVTLLASLSDVEPHAVVPAAAVLADALEEDPAVYGPDACVAFQNVIRSDSTLPLEHLEGVVSLANDSESPIRGAAIECLEAVTHYRGEALECSKIATVLEETT